MILFKANMSTSLYLHITVDELSTMMIQRRSKTSCMPIIGLQKLVLDMVMIMKEIVVISS